VTEEHVQLRNEACPCGSGKRFKHCHGRLPAEEPNPVDDKVAFIIAGTQRGGTTSLDLYFRDHPRISMAATRKELHFFDHEEHFGSESVDYAVYHAHFPRRLPQQLRGEATPSYMYWNAAPERMARYNPALKVIMILRNPISRAYSHWNKQRQRGREPLSFWEAIQAEPERIRQALPLQIRNASYVDRGFYTRQLERVWQHFPVAQTLVLRSEELQQTPETTLQRIADFLAIEPFPRVTSKNANRRDYEQPMSANEWEYLAGIYASEISQLERTLAWDCSSWRNEQVGEHHRAA